MPDKEAIEAMLPELDTISDEGGNDGDEAPSVTDSEEWQTVDEIIREEEAREGKSTLNDIPF